ncbi:hypothetical protein, partial [Brucella tritici]|uniref:hypothetical protein n=1 Tax=Brucella tritici TaxID=94626 RepID=UPI001AEDC8F9
RNRHLQKRSQTVRDLMKSPSANYRNGCPHITEKTVRELPKPAPYSSCANLVTRSAGLVWSVGSRAIKFMLRQSRGFLPLGLQQKFRRQDLVTVDLFE